MKNKFKFGLLVAIMFSVFSFVGYVHASDLTWSVDQTIDLSSPDVDLTILSGSTASSLVVNAGSIQVVVPLGDTFTVSSSSNLLFTGQTTAYVSSVCANSVITGTLVGDIGGETITITPTGVACLENHSGGGGGSSKVKTKTVTPVVVAPATAPTINPATNPATTPGNYNFGTTVLKNGSRGEAVKELQRFLNDTMNLGLVLDGVLGPKTIAVIMKWQNEHGLLADGLIGPATKAKMLSETPATPATPATLEVAPATPATPNAQGYAFGNGVVKEGTKGESCKAWQTFLNDKANAGLVADGDCGPKTIEAVKKWQASVGLTADGFLGAMSRAKALAQ